MRLCLTRNRLGITINTTGTGATREFPAGNQRRGKNYERPSRGLDEQCVGVLLSPVLAKEVARALRIQLACEFDRPFADPSRLERTQRGCGR